MKSAIRRSSSRWDCVADQKTKQAMPGKGSPFLLRSSGKPASANHPPPIKAWMNSQASILRTPHSSRAKPSPSYFLFPQRIRVFHHARVSVSDRVHSALARKIRHPWRPDPDSANNPRHPATCNRLRLVPSKRNRNAAMSGTIKWDKTVQNP